MNEKKNIIKSNLKKLDALRDHDIDYSDIPEMDDVFLQRAITVELPRKKESVTLRIDHEVLAWFKEKGRGYQTRMNAVLKTYVRAQQEHQRA